MSSFRRRINEDLWVLGDQREDGSWDIRVLDAQRELVTDPAKRDEAITAAVRDESKLRNALWGELSEAARAAILKR